MCVACLLACLLAYLINQSLLKDNWLLNPCGCVSMCECLCNHFVQLEDRGSRRMAWQIRVTVLEDRKLSRTTTGSPRQIQTENRRYSRSSEKTSRLARSEDQLTQRAADVPVDNWGIVRHHALDCMRDSVLIICLYLYFYPLSSATAWQG